MTTPTADAPAPLRGLTVVLALLAAVGLVRIAGRVLGLLVLLGVVAGCVGALTVGVLLLKAVAGW